MTDMQPANGQNDYILKVDGLKQHFEVSEGFLQRRTVTIKAVDGISLRVRENEVLGLVGESGWWQNDRRT